MRYKECKLGCKRSVMKDALLLRSKTFLVHISPSIVAGSLSNTTWYSLHMRYKQCELGCSRSVMKGTLLLRSRQFFVKCPLRLEWVSEKYHIIILAHALQTLHVRLKSVSNKRHFTFEVERVFRPYHP
jgi:hypothetical protein